MADYLIGAHVGSEDPLQAAAARSADAVQVFLADPQSWKKPEPRDEQRSVGYPYRCGGPPPVGVRGDCLHHQLRLLCDGALR